MQLYEYEAKAILTRYGFAVPTGGLWPDVPAALQYPAAVKAQVLAGGRGRRGGIKRAESAAELDSLANALLGLHFDGEPVTSLLVEEWVEMNRELYLALTLDRNTKSPVLLASANGGVAVEETAHVNRLAVDPWIGPRSYHLRMLGSTYGLPPQTFSPALDGIWEAFCAEDALLVEVNPLGVSGGKLVALDARIFVDDNARYRHTAWPPRRGGTGFETRCANLGATGVEMDGDIAVITSGAGLGMASLDLLVGLGGKVQTLIDLGPVVFQQPEKVQELVMLVAELKPKVLLANFFLQLASCDTIAVGLARGIEEARLGKVIVRMRGVRAAEARGILEPIGTAVYDDLLEAFTASVSAART